MKVLRAFLPNLNTRLLGNHSMKNKIQSSLDEIRKILRRGSGGRLGNKIHFHILEKLVL